MPYSQISDHNEVAPSYFTHQQNHLVRALSRHSLYIRDQVLLVTEFLEELPDALHQLQEAGEVEGRARECHIPACFAERIHRLIQVATRLHGHLQARTINADEAALILDQMSIHVFRLTFDISRCGHLTVGATDMANTIAEVHGASMIHDGFVGLLQSEPYLSWVSLEGVGYDCASCQDVLSRSTM